MKFGQLVLLLLCVFAVDCGFDRARIDESRCSSFPCAPGCETTCGNVQLDGGVDHLTGDVDAGLVDIDCHGAENACGGCSVLAGNPGEPCTEAPCGTWGCNGDERVVCRAATTNPCGGCSTLEGAPGDPCGGGCGAMLACGGAEELVCEGLRPNVCGGCTEVVGAELGGICACQGVLLDELHEWVCEGQELVCEDANGDPDFPTVLPDTSDVMETEAVIRGAFVKGDEVDHFDVTVIDEAGTDGLFPLIELTALTRNLDICAYWFYEDGRSVHIRCPGSSWVITDEGREGCCSFATGTTSEEIEMLNDSWGITRFDVLHGGNNDNGWLMIMVTGEEEEGCSPYELHYRF